MIWISTESAFHQLRLGVCPFKEKLGGHGTELSALSPTGENSILVASKFGKLYAR